MALGTGNIETKVAAVREMTDERRLFLVLRLSHDPQVKDAALERLIDMREGLKEQYVKTAIASPSTK